MKAIKGIIYDLDGTLISSEKINEQAWKYAGNKFGFEVANEMLLNLRSLPTMEGATSILPPEKQYLLNEFVQAKEKYAQGRKRLIQALPSAVTTIKRLRKKGYAVWICTSAEEYFVREVLERVRGFSEIAQNIVWREMYLNPKPAAEPLLLTLSKMGLRNRQVMYVGDGINDYNTAHNAKIPFLYFNPRFNDEDTRISNAVPRITSHRQIFAFLQIS